MLLLPHARGLLRRAPSSSSSSSLLRRKALLSTSASSSPRHTFDAAVRALEGSGAQLDNQQKLTFYGLFKAARNGADTGARPSAFNMVGRAKWDAWDAAARELTQDEACLAYSKEVEALIGPIEDHAPSHDASANASRDADVTGDAVPTAFRHRSLFEIAGVAAVKDARGAQSSGAPSKLEQRAEGYAHVSARLERTSGVAFVNLARPEKMNALHMPLWEEITDVFRQCSDDPLVRVVVLGGEGAHFCSGMDLSVFGKLAALADAEPCSGRRREQLSTVIQYFQDGCSSPEFCTKPVLAAIHGNAVGGAVDLLTACDLRYCTDDAYFCVKEVDLAIVADVGTMQRLPKLVGDQRARELTYTARGFGGQEAKDMGLVLESFATQELLDAHVADVAREIASKSSITVRGIKQVSLYTRDHPDVSEGLVHVKQWNTSYLMTADLQEAAGAMMERREPKFDRF